VLLRTFFGSQCLFTYGYEMFFFGVVYVAGGKT